ncbi:hypothetical protein [uncultured Draconibacterium sp.]|uniref:hypothetical protein n=1 Tax=uncultured Draconibacterium sp. TaxID=1573823 RepID=UPI0032603DB9
MKKLFAILFFIGLTVFCEAQSQSKHDFVWGNSFYYNTCIGDTIRFKNADVVLLATNNQFNTIKLNNDTLILKVSRRSLPVVFKGIRIFVADNKNVKDIACNAQVHSLLTSDALICLSDASAKMLPFNSFTFPVSYNDGFNWNMNEDNHMFSYLSQVCANSKKQGYSHEGIGLALTDARGVEKHWLVAMENSSVVWIENKIPDRMNKEAAILLQSESNPQLYYFYHHLYKNNLEIKDGQRVRQGQLLGTCWGDDTWGFVQLSLLKSDTIPAFADCFANAVNFFPQLYELYFKNTYHFSRTFTRGKVEFARSPVRNGNQKNLLAFEEYAGMGWLLGAWNVSDKVMACTKEERGNARLGKTMFKHTKAACTNPVDYYDFEINVRNGVYRIRAQVGDCEQATWQKVVFEGIEAATYDLQAGEQKWTNERVVKVNDRRLSVRIFVDPEDNKIAGLSEIVFQQAY